MDGFLPGKINPAYRVLDHDAADLGSRIFIPGLNFGCTLPRQVFYDPVNGIKNQTQD